MYLSANVQCRGPSCGRVLDFCIEVDCLPDPDQPIEVICPYDLTHTQLSIKDFSQIDRCPEGKLLIRPNFLDNVFDSPPYRSGPLHRAKPAIKSPLSLDLPEENDSKPPSQMSKVGCLVGGVAGFIVWGLISILAFPKWDMNLDRNTRSFLSKILVVLFVGCGAYLGALLVLLGRMVLFGRSSPRKLPSAVRMVILLPQERTLGANDLE
jgi:hypothetical protein